MRVRAAGLHLSHGSLTQTACRVACRVKLYAPIRQRLSTPSTTQTWKCTCAFRLDPKRLFGTDTVRRWVRSLFRRQG